MKTQRVNKKAFLVLVRFLRRHGYTVSLQLAWTYYTVNDERTKHWFRTSKPRCLLAQVSRRNVTGGFCPTNGHSYFYIDGRIAADHADCFNKWADCPLVMTLPRTASERRALLHHLRYLGTPEALEWSEGWDYVEDPRLPREC